MNKVYQVNRRLGRLIKFSIIVVILTVLFLVGYLLRVDRFGLAQVDYVDCIYFNQQLYYSGINPMERTEIGAEFVTEEIGTIRFKLSGNVHSTYYCLRNGDATFLDPGTELFTVESDPDAIAVAIDGKFYLYQLKSS